MSGNGTLTIREKILLAALDATGADLAEEFTAEDLIVGAWKSDPLAFGLRGYEQVHPDSNRVYTKIDGRTGLVRQGYLQKVGERTFRLTARGLQVALRKSETPDAEHQAKLDRKLQEDVSRILGHPEFRDWQADPSQPSKFRGAGHFWGIAAGTPASVVRSRVLGIDQTLATALDELDRRGVNLIVSQRGQTLFERADVERAAEFQETLKSRFASDLRVLDPKGPF